MFTGLYGRCKLTSHLEVIMGFFKDTFIYLMHRQADFKAAKGEINPARVAKKWNWIDLSVDFIGHLQEELIEVKRELPHKWWKELFTPDTDKVLDELADVYIHWVNLCNALGTGLGFTHADVMQAISQKINFNNKRPDQAVDSISEKLGLDLQEDLVVTPFSQAQLRVLVDALSYHFVNYLSDNQVKINAELHTLFKSQLDEVAGPEIDQTLLQINLAALMNYRSKRTFNSTELSLLDDKISQLTGLVKDEQYLVHLKETYQ